MSIDELVVKYEEEVRMRSTKKNPQYYHALKNYQWAVCLQAALKGNELPSAAWAALNGEANLRTSTGTKAFSFNPKPGDKVLELLDKARKSTSTPVADKIHEQFEEALRRNKCHVEGFYVVAD